MTHFRSRSGGVGQMGTGARGRIRRLIVHGSSVFVAAAGLLMVTASAGATPVRVSVPGRGMHAPSPSVAVNSHGDAAVGWAKGHYPGGLVRSAAVQVVVRRGSGKWSRPHDLLAMRAIPKYRGGQDGPGEVKVVPAGGRRFVAVWFFPLRAGGATPLSFSINRGPGASWSRPRIFGAQRQRLGRIEVKDSPRGDVAVVWDAPAPGGRRIYAAVIRPGANSFGAPQTVGTVKGSLSNGALRAEFAQDGALVVAWTVSPGNTKSAILPPKRSLANASRHSRCIARTDCREDGIGCRASRLANIYEPGRRDYLGQRSTVAGRRGRRGRSERDDPPGSMDCDHGR